MASMLFVVAIALVASAQASLVRVDQVPVLTMCSESPSVTVVNLTVATMTGSSALNVSFTMDAGMTLKTNSTLHVAITDWGSTSMIPCMEDVGSCMYKLCDGNSSMEMEITKAWKNTCPIPDGMYPVSIVWDVAMNGQLESGNMQKVMNYTFMEDGKVVGCVSFPVDISDVMMSSATSLSPFGVLCILIMSSVLLKY